jgi:hypothetical protein
MGKMIMASESERITALETELRFLKESVQELTKSVKELTALRNKGAGAFWLATSLAGAGAISIFLQIVHWFTGGH